MSIHYGKTFSSAASAIALCFVVGGNSDVLAQWRLGVTIVDQDPTWAPGVSVVGVTPGDPAHRHGVEPRDVIHQVNGRNVYTVADVRQAIATSRGQALLSIRDWRTGRVVLPAR